MPAPTAAFVAATMAWVAQVTGLPPAPAPRIVLTEIGPDGERLEHRAHQDGKFHFGALAAPGVIYLASGWDERDVLDRAIFVHEVSHIIDFASGRRYRCSAERERIAYAVQGYYLSQFNINFWTATGYTPRSFATVTECEPWRSSLDRKR